MNTNCVIDLQKFSLVDFSQCMVTYYVCSCMLLVSVIYTDSPRIAIDPSQSIYTVNVGTKLILHCIVNGLPIPTIQWYKNHVLIPQKSSPFYLASTDTPGITVYTCTGKNNAGNMENIARANIAVAVKSMCSIS